jgi:hypothetical protein
MACPACRVRLSDIAGEIGKRAIEPPPSHIVQRGRTIAVPALFALAAVVVCALMVFAPAGLAPAPLAVPNPAAARNAVGVSAPEYSPPTLIMNEAGAIAARPVCAPAAEPAVPPDGARVVAADMPSADGGGALDRRPEVTLALTPATAAGGGGGDRVVLLVTREGEEKPLYRPEFRLSALKNKPECRGLIAAVLIESSDCQSDPRAPGASPEELPRKRKALKAMGRGVSDIAFDELVAPVRGGGCRRH